MLHKPAVRSGDVRALPTSAEGRRRTCLKLASGDAAFLFWFSFVGANVIFFRQHFLGPSGRGTKHLDQHPSRRVVEDYTKADEREEARVRRRQAKACDRLLARLAKHHPEHDQDGKGARPRNSAAAARTCRRGNRMTAGEFMTLLGGAAGRG